VTRRQIFIWIGVLIAIAVAGAGMTLLLSLQGLETGAGVTQTLLGLLGTLVLAWGLWKLRDRRGVGAIAGLIGGLFLLATLWGVVSRPTAFALAGMWSLGAVFYAGLWLIRAMLFPSLPLFGIARTVIDEAIRMKIALVFIVLLLVAIPALPLYVMDERRPDYQIQTFLSWAITLTGFTLSLMTIFLSCATVCFEVSKRQIFLTLTKPVSRVTYIAGKWLGIVLLNLLLVAVAGTATYVGAMSLRERVPEGQRGRIDETVLVSRIAQMPQTPPDNTLRDRVAQRIQRLREQNPGQYEEPGEQELANMVKIERQAWHTLGPREQQVYFFTGLEDVKENRRFVQLVIKAKAQQSPPDEQVPLFVWINDRPMPPLKLANNITQVMNFDTQRVIDDSGVMKLRLANPMDRSRGFATTVTFTPGEGLELLYVNGGFLPNLTRGMVIVWMRLAFLGMVGIFAGSFLSFPVACVFGLMVMVTAFTSGFLAESLEYYAKLADKDVGAWERLTGTIATIWAHLTSLELWSMIKVMIRLLGEMLLLLVPSFSKYDPEPMLTGGRMVRWELVRESITQMVMLTGGVLAFLSWIVFRKRELAKVTV